MTDNTQPSRGRFIVLEGGEGAGKSTQVQTVVEWLQGRGRRVLRTREPGGSPLAEAIRRLILTDWDEGVDAGTELLLVFAARAAHLHAIIAPALNGGMDVVCDRFVDATYAYQGSGRGIAHDTIAMLETLVVAAFRPDLVLLLDVSPELGRQRAQRRGPIDRFEAEDAAFQARVRATYLERARADGSRYAIIDADRPRDQVADAIRDRLEQSL